MGAAVDEGRNPYGTPGRGNHYQLWVKANEMPCSKCGARGKHVLIEGKKATISCISCGSK